MKTLLLFFTCVTMTRGQYNYVWRPGSYADHNDQMAKDNINSTHVITNLTSDVIKDTDEKIRAIENIRLDNFRSAPYEIGFLNYVIVEAYRKMIDTYNTSVSMGGKLYGLEMVLNLCDIEDLYWVIDHLVNMQHEIERKYRVTSGLREVPLDSELMDVTIDPNFRTKKVRRTRDRLGEQIDAMLKRISTTPKKSTRWWWPIEYGWEIDYYW